MAAYTSQRAGNWSLTSDNASSPWYDGGAQTALAASPTTGDTISSLAHVVTVDANATIGTGSGTCIAITAAGRLVIAEGVELLVRGNITHANPATKQYQVDVQGGTLTFDPTASADPTTTSFTCGPTASNSPNGYIRTAKGAGNTRATIRTYRPNGNEARSYFSLNGFNTQVGLFECADTDFVDLGAAATNCMTMYPSNAANTCTFDRCTFTRCGKLGSGTTWAAGATIAFRNCTWSASLGTNSVTMYSTPAASGSRPFTGNYLDKSVEFGYWAGMTVTHNIFKDRWLEANNTAGFPSTFRWNIFYKASAGSTGLFGPLYQDSYYLGVFTGVNPQGPTLSSLTRNQEIDGFIFQLIRSGVINDYEALVGTGSAVADPIGITCTLRNSITLPVSDPTTGISRQDTAIGPVVVLTENPATPLYQAQMEYYHNTLKSSTGVQMPLWLGHPGAHPRADRVTAYKSNLVWDVAANNNHCADTSLSGATDQLTASGVTHNSIYQWTASALAGTEGTPYSFVNTTGVTPGANDVNNVDPKFVDTDRNFEKFATVYGQARSEANTLAVLAADPTTRIPELIAWIRAGFTPQAAALKGAAHDGNDIGAVAVVLPQNANDGIGNLKFALSIGF